MSGQAGIGFESTWGTAATPTVFLPVLQASHTYDPGLIMSAAIEAGELAEHRGYPGFVTAGGSLQVELHNLAIAKLLKRLFGAVSTSGAGPYEHEYSLTAPGASDGVTIQIGSEATTGTVEPYTAVGAMFDQWKLSTQVGTGPAGVAKLDLTHTAKDILKATALATASYPDWEPFTAPQVTLELGGDEFATATSAELSVNKALKKDRHHLGSRYINIQRNVAKWQMGGTFAAEFEDDSIYDHMVGLDDVAMVWTWDNGTDSLVVTANIQITGDLPGVTTQGIEPQQVAFRVCRPEGGTTADAITAVLTNGEASAA